MKTEGLFHQICRRLFLLFGTAGVGVGVSVGQGFGEARTNKFFGRDFQIVFDGGFQSELGNARSLFNPQAVEWGYGSSTVGLSVQLSTNRAVFGDSNIYLIVALANFSTNTITIPRMYGYNERLHGVGPRGNSIVRTDRSVHADDPTNNRSFNWFQLPGNSIRVFALELAGLLNLDEPGLHTLFCKRTIWDDDRKDLELTSNPVFLNLIAGPDFHSERMAKTPRSLIQYSGTSSVHSAVGMPDHPGQHDAERASAALDSPTADGEIEKSVQEGGKRYTDSLGSDAGESRGRSNYSISVGTLGLMAFLLASSVGVVWLMKRR